MQHVDFDINGLQVGNHLFIHVVARRTDAHDDTEQFMIPREKANQAVVTRKMDVVRRQQRLKLGAFQLSNTRIGRRQRAAQTCEKGERTHFQVALPRFKQLCRFIHVQNRGQCLSRLSQIPRMVFTFLDGKDDVVLVAENAAQIMSPFVRDCGQKPVFMACFVTQRDHFTHGQDANRHVQVGHRVNEAFACVQHVFPGFGQNQSHVRPLDGKDAHQRTVVAFNGRPVVLQTFKRQKIADLSFLRLGQNDFAELRRQQARKRRRRDDPQDTDQNRARPQTLNENGKNTLRGQVSFLYSYKCSVIRRPSAHRREPSRTDAVRVRRK